MYKSNLNNLSLRTVLLLGAAAAVGFATPALAQQDQNNGGVETVVVTGSLLARSDVETPSPVTIVTSQQIQASGLTTTGDIVRSLSADNSGSIPTAFGNGFASGSSGVALRGLTVNSTLVLINGRRTANYPLADDGERGFVDLNTIPLAAVDRVEVLQDGASSIYGADAIAGVVNIILKDEFQGVQGEAEWGTSQHGGGTMERLAGTLGYGDMASDHFNAYINFEYEKDDPIHANQRGFPYDTGDLSSINVGGAAYPGGNCFDPGSNRGCNFNNASSIYGRIQPAHLTNPADPTTGVSVLGSLNQILNGNTTGTNGGCGPRASAQTDATDPDAGVPGNFCEQNTVGQYGVIQAPETRYGLYAHMKTRFSNAATAYLDASYFENKVISPLGPASPNSTVPHNTSNLTLPAYLASGARNPNDPFAAACPAVGTEGVTACTDALLSTLMPGIQESFGEDNHVLRATAGLRGDWNGWTYDTAFVAAHAWLNTTNKGFLNYDQLISDVENGTYNWIDQSANSPAVLAALAPAAVKVSTTDEDSWDVRTSHDLFALPGGEAQIGFSLEARHEATFDPELNPGQTYQGIGIAHTIGNRNIYSASGEVNFPLMPNLEADVSGRFDHYSDFGDTFNPKVGLKWTPWRPITLRGTYSTGFRAPSFSENGSSESLGFATISPCGPTAGGAAFCAAHGGDAYTLPYGLGLLSTANPSIQPEKARNYTAGAILQPFTDIDLNGTVDYYNIQKTNVISPPSPGAAIGPAFGTGAIPAGYTITYDAPDPLHPGAALRPTVIAAPYINASSEVTTGLDVNIHFSTDLMEGLHWTSEVNFTQIFEFKFTPGASEPGVTLNYVGVEAPWELSSSGGTPRNKGSWANTFTWGPLDVTGTLRYTDGFREAITDATNSRNCFAAFYPSGLPVFCNMKKFYDFDLTARYHATDTIDIFGGIRNLFDEKAPLDVNNYATACGCYNPTYDQDGAVGRFFTVGVSFKD